MQNEFVLKSGATLVISMSPFEIGNELRKCVARCLRNESDALSESALQKLISDNDVERQVFLCAQKAIYAGAKVNKDLFDDIKLGEQARGDYFEMFAKILEVNLNPFFQMASSALKTSAVAAA